VGEIFERIYSVIRRIPRGTVLTYGQVARRAGLPNGARQVGHAMAVSPAGVPWHRVVGRSREGFGRSLIRDPLIAAVQRRLLSGEGVRFNGAGEIDLNRFGAGEPRKRQPRKGRAQCSR